MIPEYAFAFECEGEIMLSDEHIGLTWLSYEEARRRLTWDSNKTALYELNCRLLENEQFTLDVIANEENRKSSIRNMEEVKA